VEVNKRVNYPIKSVLVDILNQDEIDMGNDLHKACVSLFGINIASVGIHC
jgi:hypothetical protein